MKREDYLKNPDKFVYPFEIEEKNKTRIIITYKKNINGEMFRKFHEQLLVELENKFESSNLSFAYKKGYCTKDAVEKHLKSDLFVKLDISSFFESISFEKFKDKIKPTNFDIKSLECCFYKDNLSLGFVSSPKISDMYLHNLDTQIEEKINNIVKKDKYSKKGLIYSRYCDDILISSYGFEDFGKLYYLKDFIIEKLKEDFDLEINKKKEKEFNLISMKNTSVTFLGLSIVRDKDNNKNYITVSKHFILETLDLISRYKNKKEDLSKIEELLSDEPNDEKMIKKKKNTISFLKKSYSVIKSRISYIKFNSNVSFEKFKKKYKNKFNIEWNEYGYY